MSKHHNYSKYSEPTATEEVVEIQNGVTEEEVDKPETTIDVVLTGIVANCGKLNVRATARIDADILDTLVVGTEVEINLDESTDEFYKVKVSSGIDGYCVKKYISVTK